MSFRADLTLRITEPEERLDRLVARHCPDLSRSTVQRLIREASILVNGAAAKPSYLPVPGDLVQVHQPDEAPLLPVATVCLVKLSEPLFSNHATSSWIWATAAVSKSPSMSISATQTPCAPVKLPE